MEKKEIGAWVRAARQKAGLSQAGLAQRLQIEARDEKAMTKANVSHWENGTHMPSIIQLCMIREVTHYPLSGLIGSEAGLTPQPSAEEPRAKYGEPPLEVHLDRMALALYEAAAKVLSERDPLYTLLLLLSTMPQDQVKEVLSYVQELKKSTHQYTATHRNAS